jgi:hypothetical protein
MAILGVIAGVLMVLRLMPLVPEIVEAFWLGALGALFLGNWPGGRGPAWETGEADPWPSAAERRGLAPPKDEEPPEPEPPEPEPPDEAEAEPAPETPEEAPSRRSSRKRRRR